MRLQEPVRIPTHLQDVFGEASSPLEIAATLVFGLGAAVLLVGGLNTVGLAWWRTALVWVLVADIAAGCVANFTPSTNAFYAARPLNRWVFIALHVHVVVVAWALDVAVGAALAVWAYTILGAVLVNLLRGRRAHVFVAGLLLAVGLGWTPLTPGVPPALVVVFELFLLKVLFAFAVDHQGGGPSTVDAAAGDRLRDLTGADKAAFVETMRAAFAADPLFVALFGAASGQPADSQRAAFLSFLFDMNRLLGGRPRGQFVSGRLVGCSLLEPAAPKPWVASVRLLAAAVRFVPVWLHVGSRTSKLLNRYLVCTRAAAPAQPLHYLSMIGVRPDEQGRGWGKALMADALEQAAGDPDSSGVALDTENAANVLMYERWGFLASPAIELGSLAVYPMFRPARITASSLRTAAQR